MTEMREGRYGPYDIQFDAKSALWFVTATTKRALATFNIGCVGVRNGKDCKYFGDSPKVIKRVLHRVGKSEADNLLLKGLHLPDIYGLNLNVTDDGLLRIRGLVLHLYRERVDFKGRRDPMLSTSDRRRVAYVTAEIAESTIAKLKAAQDEVRAYLEVKPPEAWWSDDPKWCWFRSRADGSWSVHGRLVIAGDPGDQFYENAFEFPASRMVEIVEMLGNRANAMREFEESAEFSSASSVIDERIAAFSKLTDPQFFELSRDRTWILLRTPYELSNPPLFGEVGLRWSYADKAWIASLARLRVEDLLASVDEVTEYCARYGSR